MFDTLLFSAICQLRLDFINFSLSKSDGECPDFLTITSPSTRDPFALCGEIAGEHSELFVMFLGSS